MTSSLKLATFHATPTSRMLANKLRKARAGHKTENLISEKVFNAVRKELAEALVEVALKSAVGTGTLTFLVPNNLLSNTTTLDKFTSWLKDGGLTPVLTGVVSGEHTELRFVF